MQIDVQITHNTIDPATDCRGQSDSGAVVEFTGIVRDTENGRRIAALEYEAYESMALSEMRRLLEELGRQYPCHFVRVIHRVGVIRAGEAAIYIHARAAHRQEAFGLVTNFLDVLKKDVPIWKRRALEELPMKP